MIKLFFIFALLVQLNEYQDLAEYRVHQYQARNYALITYDCIHVNEFNLHKRPNNFPRPCSDYILVADAIARDRVGIYYRYRIWIRR